MTAERVHYRPFLYPLRRKSGQWNRLYGARGFYQYQCVIPLEAGARALKHIWRFVTSSGQHSCLAVLKTFGDRPRAGLLSFPRPGVTLALDVANRGADTLAFFDRLDAVVADAGGALYPGRMGRMSRRMFEASFPEWPAFAKCVDPRFSSSFWRRVTA